MRPDASEKIRKLIEHGKKTEWNPKHDVDWDKAGSLEKLDRAHREALRSVLSLVYYSDSQGKLILESLCRALEQSKANSSFLSPAARDFFVHQIGDESRHAEGILMLFDRLGLEPEDRALSHRLYSKILLSEGHFDTKLVLIYWYIEILAKGIFVELRRLFPETCIDSLFTHIIRDEARHVGFGEIYIPERVSGPDTTTTMQMSLAYYSSAAALPALYRFGHYAKAARILGLDLSKMFRDGLKDISAKARKLPSRNRFLDLSRPASWISALL